jgi:hypothetical protein
MFTLLKLTVRSTSPIAYPDVPFAKNPNSSISPFLSSLSMPAHAISMNFEYSAGLLEMAPLDSYTTIPNI